MSKRNSEKWLLLQSASGANSVVSMKAVISPSSDARVGTVVIVDRGNGSHEAATVIGFSRDRELLERQALPHPKREVAPEAPGPSIEDQAEEEPGDFSASGGSSWEPSDADDNASSDDEVKRKKIKLERLAHRSYSNRRNGRVIKPSHRAEAVSVFKGENNNRTANVEMKNYEHITVADKKSLPDSTRINNSPAPNQNSDIVSINVREILDMKRQFEELFSLINEIKQSASNADRACNISGANAAIKHELSLDISNTMNEDNVYNYSDDDRSRSEDLNRSDDNVLITNKYETANNKNLYEKENTNTKHKDEYSMTKHTNENNKNGHGNENIKKKNENEMKKVLTEIHDNNDDNKEWVPIGSGKTLIHKDQFNKVKWKSYTVATRTLLLAVFPRRILATHSLTGKKSPAFLNKPAKMCLDPGIVTDVIHEIVDRFNVKESLVRSIITTKCADECKMLKMRQKRKSQPVRKVALDFDEEVNMSC